jgi:thioredoxin-dependent peroxiredoxin
MTKVNLVLMLLALVAGTSLPVSAATSPQVGDAAPNFTLRTLDERAVELNSLVAKGRVVLVVLRGWPGYQCPLCTKQVHDFVARAAEFKARGAQVLMVYPGPADRLQAYAGDFLKDKAWPAEFLFVTDPDYAFTNRYALRWDAKNETAYPATFILAPGGKVEFANVSKSHGGRVGAAQVIAALK